MTSVGAKCATLLALTFFLSSAVYGQPDGRAVSIPSYDGFTLHGTHYDPGAEGPGILMIHQCNRRGDPTGFESIAPKLARTGFHVLTYDSRGFGKSRSEAYPDYRSREQEIDANIHRDVVAAYEYLRSQPGVQSDVIGVVGASCGTWQIIPFAVDRPEIHALVFLSGSYVDLPDVHRAFDGVRDRPIFAIFAEDDRYGTPESMRDAFDRATNPHSRLLILKGADHGTALFDAHPSLEDDIVRWLGERLTSRE